MDLHLAFRPFSFFLDNLDRKHSEHFTTRIIFISYLECSISILSTYVSSRFFKPPVSSTVHQGLQGLLPWLSSCARATDSPKRALITGANSGIGLATAMALAEKGWEVLPLCRSPQKLRETLEATRLEIGDEWA